MFIQLLITLTILVLTLPHPSLVKAQNQASPSGTISEEITENIKKRIQGVLQDKDVLDLGITRGKLMSISNNTLSIEGDGEVKLASTSAKTKYVRLPGSTQLKFDDLALEEYLIVIGDNQNQVINAETVVSQKNIPSPGKEDAFFGTIINYTPKTFELTVVNPASNETKKFIASRKSKLFVAMLDGTKTRIDRSQDLPLQSQVLVVFEPTVDPEAKIDIEELIMTPSSPIITPPELKP